MIGAIAGDIIGSVYEFNNIKTTVFPLFRSDCRFTDDTVLTVALADSIMSGAPFVEKLKEYHSLYPRIGYGPMFNKWAKSSDTKPYGSYGNGSAMRVSPVGFSAISYDEAMLNSSKSAHVTHDHPDGIKGAQAVAAAIWMARKRYSKDIIRYEIYSHFNYLVYSTLDEIRPTYRFDPTCQGSVPQAIIAFLESTSYEDCVRKAVSIGGDSDTIACMAGGIAGAFYGVPNDVKAIAYSILDDRLASVVRRFSQEYGC